MPTATEAVPVTIQPEALAHANKLGVREPMERVIEQMKAMTPQMLRIDVSLEYHPEDPTMEPQIFINGIEAEDARPAEDISLLEAYSVWMHETFPPEVTMQFVTFVRGGRADER